MNAPVVAAVLVFLCLPLAVVDAHADAVVADHSAVLEFESIPSAVVESVSVVYRVFYGHTSHGSQIMTGLDMVYAEDTLYAEPQFHEISDDLGHNGDTSWVAPTRNWLNGHPDYNVAMWSWCGGCSDNTEEGIDIYLNAMNGLEQEFPDVTFIYMTGHLDGGGPGGNLYARNNQIRAYCNANDKVLFDFADIESWDPDGTYYPDESDYCYWCYTWCSSHPCPSCGGCAHSHCFNCYLKGKGFWWMMARVWGWNSAVGIEIADAFDMPGVYHLGQNRPNPFNPFTEIIFRLPEASVVELVIYDVRGRKVITLADGFMNAGDHSVPWDGNDSSGESVVTGCYFYRLSAGEFVDTRKMALIK